MSLRYAILGLLTQEGLSGYEITRRFEQSVGYFWHARSQQIYPELSRLEAEGLVTGAVVPQRGRPDKRVYSITPEGRARLRQWVLTPSPPTFVKDEFMVKVWSYGEVDPRAAAEALAEHRAQHEERLVAYTAIRAGLAGDEPATFPDEVFGAYLTLEGGIAMEEAFVAWCRRAEAMLARRAAGR